MATSASIADERVAGVTCDEDRLIVDLMDGRTIAVPLSWYPRLQNATPEQRAYWELAGGGYGIHWPELDEDLSTEGLVREPLRRAFEDRDHPCHDRLNERSLPGVPAARSVFVPGQQVIRRTQDAAASSLDIAARLVEQDRTMPHFLLIYELAPDYLERRSAFRDRHLALAWQAADAGALLLGGAVGDPVESALLVFSTAEAAGAFAKADPYVAEGLVRSWRVVPWATVAGPHAAAPLRPDSAAPPS